MNLLLDIVAEVSGTVSHCKVMSFNRVKTNLQNEIFIRDTF